jgi:hypothetical protein
MHSINIIKTIKIVNNRVCNFFCLPYRYAILSKKSSEQNEKNLPSTFKGLPKKYHGYLVEILKHRV